MNGPKSRPTEWVQKSEFRGRYQTPDKPFPWWYLVILAVLGIVAVTLAIISWNARADGTPIQEPPILECWVTGYSGEEGYNGSTTTANGTTPSWGTCATDPDVIPYGSVLYIPAYADLCGRYAVALDCGPAIQGNDVDLWTETDAQSYSLTGWHTVKMLRRGWHDWLVRPEAWGLK